MAHTPGRWQVRGPCDYLLPRDPTWEISAGGPYWVAHALTEEDAQLIAAAPGMLARLQQALVYLEHPEVQALGFCKPAAQMAEQIREIIREATVADKA